MGGGGADTLIGGAGNDRLVDQQAPSWSPLALPGLALWLDAADLDGDGVQEGLSETGLSGSSVNTWTDKSGQGRNATAVSAPTYTLNGMNSLPVLTFAEGNYFNLGGTALSNLGATGSMTSIQRSTDTAYMLLNFGSGVFSWVVASGWGTNFGFSSTGAPTNYFLNGAAVPTATDTRDELYTATNNTTYMLSVTSQSFTGFTGTTSLAGYGSGWSFTGVLPELILTSQALSSTDRQLLEGYLAWKWGTQASLPIDHPYRSVNPASVVATTLQGGAGNDTLVSANNHAALVGGDGSDTADLSGQLGSLTLTLDAAGNATRL
jgi:hypothetical protein